MVTTSGQSWCARLGLVSYLAMGGAIANFGDCANAQIVPDGTLPSNSIVTPQGNTSIINGGHIAGSNLFHSFEEFSVRTGGAAYFNNALNIQNIISRVTGSSISNIDGLLGANGTANLFLLNSNGIIFGPNASLSIGGSFVGSTASSLNFADGTQFSATARPTTPLLTVSVPLGLQFGGTAGSILNQSQATNSSGEAVGLQVQPGKTLALVGGDVSMDGGILQAQGGRVELGGVAGAGTVGLFVDSNNLGLSFPIVGQLRDVSLTNGSSVNVSAGGGGSIALNARNLYVLAGSRLQAGIASDLGSVDTQGGDITLNAKEAITIANDSVIANEVLPRAVGNGGGINITTGSIAVNNGAQLSATTSGMGDAGSVTIHSQSTVSFDGTTPKGKPSGAFSQVRPEAVGNGGGINITTGALAVTNGAQLNASTFGRGDAGSVNINAREWVSFDGVDSKGFSSAAYSNVVEKAEGNGGSINITTGSLAVSNGAALGASTRGQGNAGSVTIHAQSRVSFDGTNRNGTPSAAFSQVRPKAVGNGGGINITAGSLAVTNGAQLSATTWGQGDAGSVNINARERISFDGMSSDGQSSAAYSSVAEKAVGNSGGINITTGTLSVTDGAQLDAKTWGRGDAGSVNINARESVSFDGVGSKGFSSTALSQVEAKAVGNGGGINITTGSLAVTNGAQLNASTLGQGNAGSVTIRAQSTASFDGVGSNELSSAVKSNVANTAVGNGGSIDIKTGVLAVTNGAQLAASTRGRGNAGSVKIRARTVSFDGVGSNYSSSTAFSEVEAKAVGNADGINITTGSLAVRNGALLSASTRGQGNGGNITLNANTLEAVNGGQVLTTSRSSGRAGNITLKVTKSVTLAGSDPTYNDRFAHFGEEKFVAAGPASGLFASTSENSTAVGGSLKITTGQLIVRDGAQVNVSSEGTGNAGNLEIASRDLLLDNLGALRATTSSGEGGNITLLEQDLILMRHNSEISTIARGTGNGGNIEIVDADSIIAVPSEDSDIVANAFEGNGGNINITTQGIFGLEFRDELTPESDITASSEFGVNGTVEINTPDFNPTQGLASLPVELVDASRQIATSCAAVEDNKFVITGRGGLPRSPNEVLSSDAVWVDWVTLNPKVENSSRLPVSSNPTAPESAPIVEARGWVINDKGEVVLTANAPTTTPYSPWMTAADCRTIEASS